MSQKILVTQTPKSIWTDTVWLLLLLLTLMSYFFAENAQSNLVTPIILSLATLKATLIGLEFMELKRQPWIFGLCFFVFFSVLALGLVLLLRN